MLSAGMQHTCGLNAAGRAFCWGPNYAGMLGTGDSESSTRVIPTAVLGGLTFQTISAGGGHTCALSTTGAAYCWGLGSSGQLGNGSTTNRATPFPVSGGHTFTRLTVGYAHTCGLVANGTLYCWGNNFWGQLGIGSNTNQSTPVATTGGRTFVRVSAGGSHTCALVTVPGAAYCWGTNENGEVGDGTTITRTAPTLVSGGRIYQGIAVGFYHSCAFTAQFFAYCWGMGSGGQVGNGTYDEVVAVPAAVAGNKQFAFLAAGNMNTCGFISSDPYQYCWGMNGYGQLGYGAVGGQVAQPTTPFIGTGTLKSITVGGAGGGPSHVCAVNIGYLTFCWGSNSHGQLGAGMPPGVATGVVQRIYLPQ